MTAPRIPDIGADERPLLAPYAHRVTLRGAPGDLAFPALCPNCGAAASCRLAVRKTFHRESSDSDVGSSSACARVPFCDRCCTLHRRHGGPSLLGGARNLPGALGAAWMVALTLGPWFVVQHGCASGWLHGRCEGWRLLLVLLVALAFCGGCLRWAKERRRRRSERQSMVTIAFDFTDDLAGSFEGERRMYAMRDARFARAFEAANRERIWDARSPQAARVRRRALRLEWATLAVVLAAMLVYELLRSTGH